MKTTNLAGCLFLTGVVLLGVFAGYALGGVLGAALGFALSYFLGTWFVYHLEGR